MASADQALENVAEAVAERPVYRGAIVVGAVALGAFALLAVLVSSGASMHVDTAILATIHQFVTPTVVSLALVITMLGSEAIWVLLPLSLVVLWMRRLRWQVLEVGIAMVGAQVANDLLKLGFHRERPSGFSVVSTIPGQGYSFPSGHAMVSIAFYGALAYVGWRVLAGWHRPLWMGTMVAIIAIVGMTRLVLAAHYPTDVLASWALGLLWLDITLVGVGRVHQRASDHAEVPPQAPAAAP
jgi:undecaprenyl-diphosphatase